MKIALRTDFIRACFSVGNANEAFVSETRIAASLETLRNRLHERARELQTAEGTVHALRLEQLARDNQIHELRKRIAELETQVAAMPAERSAPPIQTNDYAEELERIKAELSMRAQELEFQDRIVAAAQRERETHSAYVEHLRAQLAELRSPPQESPSLRHALKEAARAIRGALKPPQPPQAPSAK